MITLNSKQRKFLEKIAQNLQSVVIIGQNGVTPQVENMISDTLKIHELVKVSFNEYKEEKRELSRQIEQNCNATLVRIIGNKSIFYKANEKKDLQQYEKQLSKLL